MKSKEPDLNKFAKTLAKSWVNDIKKDIDSLIPKWFETLLKQRLKGINYMQEDLEDVKREVREIGKDGETNKLTLEQLRGDYADLVKTVKELKDELKKVVKDDNKELAKSVAEDFQTISERKPKALWKFWKRRKK